MISFSDFKKTELRVAKILSAEDIPGKDKLYKVLIDLGAEKRTIVSGLKNIYSREELLGKNVVVVSNLEKARIAGIESNGMLLACQNSKGEYRILLADESVSPGTLVE